MTAYRYPDGTITDVDPVALDIKRAREYRARGSKGWAFWSRLARQAFIANGGRLEVLSDDEEAATDREAGFAIDPAKRYDAAWAARYNGDRR